MGKEKNIIKFYHNANVEIVHGRSIHNFPRHSHIAFCIGLVEKGELKLDIEGKEYFLKKNDVYIIPPHTEHKISSVNQTEYGYKVLCLRNYIPYKNNNFTLDKYVYQGDKAAFEISKLFINVNAADYIQLEQDIKQFFTENIKIEFKSNCSKDVTSAIDYIKDNLEEPFNLEKISVFSHLSKYHFVRLFKKHMGVAPYQFYMQEKVKKVKQELLKNETPVDLAYNLNFSDQSHLNNIFKRYVGITPLQYKASYKEEHS